MFVILHDNERLHATRLKDNNEIAASVAGVVVAIAAIAAIVSPV